MQLIKARTKFTSPTIHLLLVVFEEDPQLPAVAPEEKETNYN